jgi:hypothetical protein
LYIFLLDIMESSKEEIKPASEHFLTRGIYTKFNRIISTLTDMKKTISSVLYISLENAKPLSEEEKEIFKRLNEVWGDDKDEVYAKSTHFQLKKNLQYNGI